MSDKKSLEESILDTAQQIEAPTQQTAEQPNLLEQEGISQEEFNQELELEKKYGDQPVRTFLEAGASAATLGLSDAVLRKLVGPKALRERRERNRAATISGEIIGTVAPTLASGGTSAVAKGTAAAGSAVVGASKLGLATEKAIAKAISATGKKKLARSIIEKSVSKGAGSAVEAGLIGTGQLVSEAALGNQDFNAENLAAFAGTGALLGGAAGGVFGTAEALIPVVKKGKVVDYAQKKVKTADINQAAAELSGLTPSKITKVKSRSPYVYDNLGDYYKNTLKLQTKDQAKDIYQKNLTAMNDLGNKLSKTIDDVDSLADDALKPTRSALAQKMQKNLDDLAEDFRGVKSVSAENKLQRIEKEKQLWDDWLADQTRVTGKELNDLKRKYQKLAKYDRDPMKISLDEKINRNLASAVREEVLELADRVSTVDKNLGSQLRKQNLDYSTAATLAESLEKKVDKEAAKKWIGLRDMMLGNVFLGADAAGLGAVGIAAKKFAESDLRRKLQILTSIESANKKVESKIASSISGFFNKARKIATPTSTKILLSTSFATDKKNRKKSTTRQEGFKRVREELVELKTNPEKLVERLSKNSLRMTKTAPMTAGALEQTIVRSVEFLNSKLPGPKIEQGTVQMLMKKKEYKPSTLELAKFERYLEGVEQPLSILDDLESGRVSREKVEAVREVYPDLYKRIQGKVMEMLNEKADSVGYQKRLQLGVLLDIPADTSLVPKNMLKLQQSFVPEEAEAADQGAVSTTQGGLENIDFASDAQTDAQKVSSRK